MFGYLKRCAPDQPFTLAQVFGLTDPDLLVTHQLNRLIADWQAEHGIKPTGFGRLHRSLYGLTWPEQLALIHYASERLHHIMLHDPCLSESAARLAKVMGSIDRARNPGPDEWQKDDIVNINRDRTLSCNRCRTPLTWDHCRTCFVIDLDLVQFSFGRKH